MPSIQTRVFRRIVPSSTTGNLQQAIDDVSTEVNAFLASLPNLGDALDLHTNLSPMGSNTAYVVTVTFVST